jgi:hypothetical protein
MKRLECAVCLLTIVAAVGLVCIVAIAALNMLDANTNFDPAVQNMTIASR